MTDELKQALEKEHTEELNGYKHYMELATKAEQEGHHEVCGVLKDIAHEEHTHAEALAHILHK